MSNFSINMSLNEYLTYCDIISKKNCTNIYDLNLINSIKVSVHLNLKKNIDKDSLVCSYLGVFLLTSLFPEIIVKQKDLSLQTQEKSYIFLVDIKNKYEIHKFLTRFFLDLTPKITKKIKIENSLNFLVKIPIIMFKELEVFLNIKEFNFISDLDVTIEFYTKNKQKLNKNYNIYNLIPFFWING